MGLSKPHSSAQKTSCLNKVSFVDALFMRAHINTLDQEYEAARQQNIEKAKKNTEQAKAVISINVKQLVDQAGMAGLRVNLINVRDNIRSVTSTDGLDSQDSVIDANKIGDVLQPYPHVSSQNNGTIFDEGVGSKEITVMSAASEANSAEEISTMTARFNINNSQNVAIQLACAQVNSAMVPPTRH